MIVKIVYDVDGVSALTIKGYDISVQLFPGTTTVLIKVCNKKGKITKTYHFSNVYMIKRVI